MPKRKGNTIPLFGPRLQLTCSTEAMAEMLSISATHLRDLMNENKTPPPVMLGRCLRWPVRIMESWVEAGCPDRPTWENLKLEESRA